MRLFLLRHAEAGPSRVDDLKQLTVFGRAQVPELVGKLDAAEFAKIEAVEHSPLLRALETAELFRQAAGLDTPMCVCPHIKPEDDPRWTAGKVAASEKDRLLVGHNPHFEYLVSLLLTQNLAELQVAFRLAACMALERYSEPSTAAPFGYWQLLWFVAPRQPE
jgi:phosphohistidine phosphatase SixA